MMSSEVTGAILYACINRIIVCAIAKRAARDAYPKKGICRQRVVGFVCVRVCVWFGGISNFMVTFAIPT